MKKTVRIIAMLLGLLIILPSVIACGENTNTPSDTTTSVVESKSDVTTLSEEERNNPNLESVNWNGAEFVILYNGNDLEPNLDFAATEESGSLLNDAVYKRNAAIEEKHQLKISGSHESDSAISSNVTNVNKSGDTAIHLVEVNQNYSMTLAINGQSAEISALKNVNTEKPYWNSKLLKGSSIANKNYFAYSDANVHAFGATPVTIFNKEVHKDFQLDDLYKLVSDGKWTYDRMSEMVKKVTGDLDGDQKITKDDRLGMIANNFCVDCFISGTGYMMLTKDENDLPQISYNNEEFYNIIEGMKNLLSADNGMFLVDRTDTSTEAREYWTEWAMTSNRALFWIGNFKCVERLRAMETDFGVIPMPKFNEDQENYAIHMQANIGAAMSVPAMVDCLDDVSTILEDIAYQSYLQVMPQYMEVLIQGQLVRDSDSLVSINIIRNSYYCDLGFMLGNFGVSILTSCRSIVTGNGNTASTLTPVTRVNEKKIKELVSKFSA